MSKTKNLFALLIFTFAVSAANDVFAQDSDNLAAGKPSLFVVSAPKPAYPLKAVIAKVEGDAQVDVKINAQGEVIESVFVSGNELFKQSVTDYARKWKFSKTNEDEGIRKAQLTFMFRRDDEKKMEADETKYRYRTIIYFQPTLDCFNDCDATKKP
jgi:TonB family protein